jgi:hypothetical protein
MSKKRSKKSASPPSLPAPPDAPTPSPEKPEQPAFECRACGCRHLPVYYTRVRKGFIFRSRRCRNCGKPMTTRERTV